MITRKISDKLVGLSTDTKPINVNNGTKLFCMDSKKTYIFDKAGATWYEYVDPDAPSGGGGLPEYENSDLGKALTLADSGKSITTTYTIVQEQTVALTNQGGQLADGSYDVSMVSNGDTVIVTHDGATYESVVEISGSTIVIELQNPPPASEAKGGTKAVEELYTQIEIDQSGGTVLYPEGDSITIGVTKTVTEAIPAPAWSSSGGVLVVHESVSGGVATLDKTYQEIVDAGFASLISSVGSDEYPGYTVYVLYYYGGTAADGFEVEFSGDGTLMFTADSANDYPSRNQGQ